MSGRVATAAVLQEFGAPLIIQQVEFDELAGHEVRIRVVASGLCRSDLTVAETNHGFPPPLLLGHEVSGVVEEVGAAVAGVRVGDHVVACPVNHCGVCVRCRAGLPFQCTVPTATRRSPDAAARVSVDGVPATQFIGIGGFATQVVCHENLVVPIPRKVPFDVACLLGCGVATGVGAALNSARIQRGDTVLVIGCGGVGLNVVQGARIAGATQIIAVDTNRESLELAARLGATSTVHPDDGDVVSAVKVLTGGEGVSHAFEVIGYPETLNTALEALRKGGRAYLVGVQKPDATLNIPFRHFFEQKSVHGVAMGSTIPRLHLPEYAQLYLQGRLQLDPLVANRISLDEVNEGLHRLRTGGVARSVIIFD